MIYRRTKRFWKAYQNLSPQIQDKVIKAFLLFREDQNHPSLLIKKIKGYEGVWEDRIDRQYRFTFHFEKNDTTGEIICVFRNVDNNDACLKNP